MVPHLLSEQLEEWDYPLQILEDRERSMLGGEPGV